MLDQLRVPVHFWLEQAGGYFREDQLALAVHADHPLASRSYFAFVDTLQFDHVGLQPNTTVHTMLQRVIAQGGGRISYRVIVSNFDAALRKVEGVAGKCARLKA